MSCCDMMSATSQLQSQCQTQTVFYVLHAKSTGFSGTRRLNELKEIKKQRTLVVISLNSDLQILHVPFRCRVQRCMIQKYHYMINM